MKKWKRVSLKNFLVRKLDKNENDYSEWEETELQKIGTFYGGLSGKGKDDFGRGLGKYITYTNVNRNTFIDHSILESVNVSVMKNKIQ